MSKKDIKRYRKIWVDMFGENGEMDSLGFRKWIKAIGIFPNLDEDAPIVSRLCAVCCMTIGMVTIL